MERSSERFKNGVSNPHPHPSVLVTDPAPLLAMMKALESLRCAMRCDAPSLFYGRLKMYQASHMIIVLLWRTSSQLLYS